MDINVTKENQLTNLKWIKAQGHYLNKMTMLLDHRTHKGQVGFDVLTPFQINHNQKLLLVNRGWVPQPAPETLPIVKTIDGDQTITGYIKMKNEYVFTLGENILNPKQWPLVMQKIDFNTIDQLTQHTFYPFVLRLDPKDKQGYLRDWQIVNVLPQRHFGYAVQWFTMALALVILYFFFSCSPINNEEVNSHE